jgi:hypothetical protein
MLTRWEGEFWSMLKDNLRMSVLRMSSASLKALDLKTSLICTDAGRALQEESLAQAIPIVEKPGTSLWKVRYCAAEWEARAQIKVRLIRSVSLALRPYAYYYHRLLHSTIKLHSISQTHTTEQDWAESKVLLRYALAHSS